MHGVCSVEAQAKRHTGSVLAAHPTATAVSDTQGLVANYPTRFPLPPTPHIGLVPLLPVRTCGLASPKQLSSMGSTWMTYGSNSLPSFSDRHSNASRPPSRTTGSFLSWERGRGTGTQQELERCRTRASGTQALCGATARVGKPGSSGGRPRFMLAQHNTPNDMRRPAHAGTHLHRRLEALHEVVVPHGHDTQTLDQTRDAERGATPAYSESSGKGERSWWWEQEVRFLADCVLRRVWSGGTGCVRRIASVYYTGSPPTS